MTLSTSRRPLRLWPSAALLLLFVGTASAQEGKLDLRPAPLVGERIKAAAELSSSLQITLSVQPVALSYTRLQETSEQRAYEDEILAVKGRHRGVLRRRYTRHSVGSRDSAGQALQVSAGTLHRRYLRLAVTKDRKIVITDPKTDEAISIPLSLRLDEPFEACLPSTPVKLGARWALKDDQLKKVLGDAAGKKPKGVMTMTLAKTISEPAFEGQKAENIAQITVKVELTAEAADGTKTNFDLSGLLRFSLAQHRLLSVKLEGAISLKAEHREGDATRRLDGQGKLSILKSFRKVEKKD